MSTRVAKVTEGGQNGPSDSVEDERDPLADFASLLGEMLMDNRGELSPEARAQLDLRSDKERAEILETLVRELAPSEVQPRHWQRWYVDGTSPFGSKGLTKPQRLKHGVEKQVTRGPASLRPHRERVEKAKAELEYAEQTLAYHEALDKSLLDWVVTDHLIRSLSPVFAMGPAWTIMRTVSSHVSDDEMEFQVGIFSGEEKIEVEAEVRQERMQLSEKIMASLDYFSGDYKFEIALRSAIEKVVDEYEPKRVEMIAAGRRARGRRRMFETINPEASEDVAEVVVALEETRKTASDGAIRN